VNTYSIQKMNVQSCVTRMREAVVFTFLIVVKVNFNNVTEIFFFWINWFIGTNMKKFIK
jgi:hypothetical protein